MSDEKPMTAEEALDKLGRSIRPVFISPIRQELAALRAQVGELNKTNYDLCVKINNERCDHGTKFRELELKYLRLIESQQSPPPEQPQEKKKGLVSEALKRQGIDPDTVKKETAELAVISPKRFESDIDEQLQAEPDGAKGYLAWHPDMGFTDRKISDTKQEAWEEFLVVKPESFYFQEEQNREIASGWRVVPVKLLKMEG